MYHPPEHLSQINIVAAPEEFPHIMHGNLLENQQEWGQWCHLHATGGKGHNYACDLSISYRHVPPIQARLI